MEGQPKPEVYILRPPPPFRDPFHAREERERARRAALLPRGASPEARAFMVHRGEVPTVQEGGKGPAGPSAVTPGPRALEAAHGPEPRPDTGAPLPLSNIPPGVAAGGQPDPAGTHTHGPQGDLPRPELPPAGPSVRALTLFPEERETTDKEDALAQFAPAPKYNWTGFITRVAAVPLVLPNGRAGRVFWIHAADGTKYSTASADLGAAALVLASSGDRAHIVYRQTVRGPEALEVALAA